MATALILPQTVRAQRETVDPDPAALAAATDLRRAGTAARTVAREMLSTHRQTGPQLVAILVRVGYPDGESGRAVAAEARTDIVTAATWMAKAAVTTESAYTMLYEFNNSGTMTVRALIGAAFPVTETLRIRQRVHPVDTRTHLADLLPTRALPRDIGSAMNHVLSASTRNAAADMLHAGYTVLAVALALRDGYNLSPAQIGNLLVGENVDAIQVLVAFLDPAFGMTELAAVTVYRGFGGDASKAAVLLRDRGRNPDQVGTVLTQAGYDVTAIGDALDSTYSILTPAQIGTLLISAGHPIAAVTAWMNSAGVSAYDIIVILRAAGAPATQTASSLLAAGSITTIQHAAFAGWARQAGYDCAAVAVALRVAFQTLYAAATSDLLFAQCVHEEAVAAIAAAYSIPLAQVATALIQAGVSNEAAFAAVARATINAGSAVGSALTSAATAVGLTLERSLPVIIEFLADIVSLEQAFAWLKSQGVNEKTATTWARNAGQGATAVAKALQTAFGATSLAVAHALAEAGYNAVELVTAMKDGLGLTLQKMNALSEQLMSTMMLTQNRVTAAGLPAAIVQVYGTGELTAASGPVASSV